MRNFKNTKNQEGVKKLEEKILEKVTAEYIDIYAYLDILEKEFDEGRYDDPETLKKGTIITLRHEISNFETKSKNPEEIRVLYIVKEVEHDEDEGIDRIIDYDFYGIDYKE